MAGLLDALFTPQSGGLLDFLRNNAMNQQMQSGLASDQAQYDRPPLPMQANAQMMPPQQAAQPAAPQAAPAQPAPTMPQASGPSFGSGLSSFLTSLDNGFQSIGNGGSIIGALTGNNTDPKAQQANLTAAYLRKAGVPEEAIAAAVGNGRVPGNPEVLKTILATNIKRESFRPATPEERKAAGLNADSNTPMFINTETNEPKFGPAQTNVNVSTEKTGQAELAKSGVESFVAAQNAARDAQKRVAMYDAMEKAAQGFTPGASAEMRLTAKRYLKDAGLIKGEDVPDGEIMQMTSRQLGIHAQPKGQGAVSNYERELFAKSLPNMTQSPEGLKMAIDISRKLEQHDQKVAEIYRQSARESKTGLPNYLEVQEKIAALGSPLSDNQMAAINGGPAAPATKPVASTQTQQFKEGMTATNPQTGQKLTFRNGKWQ